MKEQTGACPEPLVSPAVFPRTRYQGSKRRLAASIAQHLHHLPFTTVLDAFGGTGAVAHAFKAASKHVTYNDVLAFNHQIGAALIENDGVRLDAAAVESIGDRQPGRTYGDFIERTFHGIYFTDAENRWLDTAVGNIRSIPCRFRRAVAWFALFQSALAKRPYNLFHRRNLYMRTADVPRGFGNKTTWDRPFADHFRDFVREANRAIINGRGTCRAVCADAMDLDPQYDLVYIDPPYINRAGAGVDYRDFYHFLEGMVRYDQWTEMIDRGSKHLRLARPPDPWSNPARCRDMFRSLFERFRRSILVVSYRSDGIPSINELALMLGDVKRTVRVIQCRPYQYALSTRRTTAEMLLIGTGAG